MDSDAKERELEQGLVDRIIDTLREFGEGFSFVGRQVHFDDGDDLMATTAFRHSADVHCETTGPTISHEVRQFLSRHRHAGDGLTWSSV